MSLASGQIHEGDGGGAKQERVDFVEVAVKSLEDFGKGLAEIEGGGAGDFRADLSQLVVAIADPERDLAAVKDCVVGAADADHVVGGNRRQRSSAVAADNLFEVIVQGVQLVEGRFERAGDDLHGAGEAGGAGGEEREVGGRDTAACGNGIADGIGRELRGFKDADDARGFVGKAEFLEEGLAKGGGTHGSAAHGEVFFAGDLPAGVLRGEAGEERLVGLDCHDEFAMFAAAGFDLDAAAIGEADLGE